MNLLDWLALENWRMRLNRRLRRETEELNATMTRTGETFGERRSYHERGESSPGEQELAARIRERMERGDGK